MRFRIKRVAYAFYSGNDAAIQLGRDAGREDSVQIGGANSGEVAIQGDEVDIYVDMEEGCEDEEDEEGEKVMAESEFPTSSSGRKPGREKDLSLVL
ncbi:hypothetical protein M9H77_34666 [Catharanthus roseus]|uniref:Uncharacterized protein n=1 Tax=Catharanthus roseus TaxID=4058 RepID=A0ACB9ZN09_CATRO|nr:hypothetical protein M9H77_34666 [Catharanthus roseus]